MMRPFVVAGFLGLFLAGLTGCVASLQTLVAEEGEAGLINYALASYGTKVYVSEDNPAHPASTLNNGIKSSEAWDQGEGWESHYDGPYAYGRYFAYGQNTMAAVAAELMRERYARAQGERVDTRDFNPQDFEEQDDNWRGLRGNDFFAGGVRSALGWVVLEFPDYVQLNKVVIYTLDSERYPAEKYGVSHVRLQYWAESNVGAGWNNVERLNKRVGQQDDSLRDIKTGRIVFRFKPVKTRKIRVAVLWTNDAERYRTFGRRHYVRGTIRLVEIEAYGFGKRVNAAEDVASAQEALQREDEQILDQLLVADTSSQPSSEPALPKRDPRVEAMDSAVQRYAQAYASRDVEALIGTISDNYAHEGETREGLRTRMQRLFERYPQLQFRLDSLESDPETGRVRARYELRLEPEAQPLRGVLEFQLEAVGDRWLIRSIVPR